MPFEIIIYYLDPQKI